MRFSISTEILIWRVPPSSGVLIVLTVGSESSSATKGSSVESVAGKNRAPANPWPYVCLVAQSSHSAQASQKTKGKCFMNMLQFDEKASAPRRDDSRVAKGEAANPCTRTAQLTQARTNSGASAAAERAANTRIQTRRNYLLRIQNGQTVAKYWQGETHKSCRFSAQLTANPAFSRNFFHC